MVVDFLLKSVKQKASNKDIGSNSSKSKAIIKLKQFKRFSKLLEIGFKSNLKRNDLIVSKTLEYQWRVRHALASHSQAKTRW